MQPNDYEAHLGLALALRGQITDANFDKQLAATQAELEKAKQIDPNRPDTYYNQGILVQEFEAKSGGDKAKTIAGLKKAQGIFQQFVQKAEGKPEYEGAVKRTKERLDDIDKIIKFLEEPDLAPEPSSKPPETKPTEGAPPNAGQAGANPTPAPGGDKPAPVPADPNKK
jgi:hypothetical protein